MKSKKLAALVIVGALVLSSGVLYASSSDDKCGTPEKTSKGRGWAGKHDIFKDLNLTDQQKKMLEENKAKHKEEMKVTLDAIRQARDSMRQELQKEKLDMAKVGRINDELKKLEAQMIDRRLEGVLEVRKILSPQQFQKFMSKMEKRMEHFKPKRD